MLAIFRRANFLLKIKFRLNFNTFSRYHSEVNTCDPVYGKTEVDGLCREGYEGIEVCRIGESEEQLPLTASDQLKKMKNPLSETGIKNKKKRGSFTERKTRCK